MLADTWQWITQLGNSKVIALLIFFPMFLLIIAYVYGSKKRSERLESYKYMPFQDDDAEGWKNKSDTSK